MAPKARHSSQGTPAHWEKSRCSCSTSSIFLYLYFGFGSSRGGILLLTHLVKHAAFAGEEGTGLNGELVDEDVATDTGGGMERQELFNGEVSVDGAYDVGVLAEDVAVDDARVADDELAVELNVTFESTVEAEVARCCDVAFDEGAIGDDVDG